MKRKNQPGGCQCCGPAGVACGACSGIADVVNGTVPFPVSPGTLTTISGTCTGGWAGNALSPTMYSITLNSAFGIPPNFPSGGGSRVYWISDPFNPPRLSGSGSVVCVLWCANTTPGSGTATFGMYYIETATCVQRFVPDTSPPTVSPRAGTCSPFSIVFPYTAASHSDYTFSA